MKRITSTASLVTRFWDKVQKGEGCWEWLSAKNEKGRGVIWHQGGNLMAPRVCWFLIHGVDPGARLVCHSCDNPGCVNPAHLWLGDESDNIQDALKKGRVRTGSRATQAKLKESDVIEIRALLSTTTMTALGQKYGVARSTIGRIRDGEIWNYISGGKD